MSKFKISNEEERTQAIKKLESLSFKTAKNKPISYRFEVVKNVKNSGNAYYWVCLSRYAKYKGEDKKAIHESLRIMFLEEFPDQRKNFYKVMTALGRVKIKELTTAELDSASLVKLTEFMREYCKNDDCFMPEPK